MTADTVVITCSLKTRSETRMLFRATCMSRVLTDGRKPRSNCCVTVIFMFACVHGVKSSFGEFSLANPLLKPYDTDVPVRNPFCIEKFVPLNVCTSAFVLVAVRKVLVCGEV